MVVPGSQQVKAQAEAEGLDEVFRAAGFDWRSAGCSMCLGMNPDIAAPGERCASTSNRNFEGRQGRGGAHAPRQPEDGRRGRDRGPFRRHQGVELTHESRSTSIEGAVSVLDRDDVDTDQIIPKQFLKRVERTGFGEFLFYDWAKEPGWELPANPILVTGRNFGCGSSREHAPWALEDYGFEAVDRAQLRRHLLLQLHQDRAAAGGARRGRGRGADGGRSALDRPGGAGVRFDGREVAFEIDQETKRRLLEGLDDIGVTLQQQDAIDAYEAERERQGPVTTARVSGLRQAAATGTPPPTTASRRPRSSGP